MSNMDKLITIHGLFHALMVYVDKYSTTPKSHDEEDINCGLSAGSGRRAECFGTESGDSPFGQSQGKVQFGES